MSDKIVRSAKDKLATFRATRGPKPDPQDPHNPFHLPDADMRPRRGVPTVDEFRARGGDGMQAIHTATLPNPLVWNWPGQHTDALYQFCWDHHHQHGDVSAAALVERLDTEDLDVLLEALDGFKLEDLAPVGVAIYEAMVDEAERRKKPDAPRQRIAVDIISDALHERAAEQREELPEPEEAGVRQLRRFP